MLPLLLALLAVGPAERACPPGIEVVRDGPTLTAALAGGADELWLAGRIHGDFAAARSVALRGCEGATLEGTGRGTVLSLKGDDIRVENLALERSGARVSSEDGALKISGRRAQVRRVAVRDALYGIALEQCEGCAIEDSHVEGRAHIEANQRGDGIKLWEAHGSTVRRNLVQGARDVVVWYSRQVTLEDNVVRDGRYGTHFMYAHDAKVLRNEMRGNTVSIFVMYSARLTAEHNVLAGARGPAGMGIGFKESDALTLRRNHIVANTVGVYLDNTPRNPSQPVVFERNLIALNGTAARMHGSERGAHFQRNDFVGNERLLEVDGNGDALEARFEHNYWEPYAGYDLDRNGEGDVAFELEQPASELRSSQPLLRYFHGTAALGLYDALALALPYFGSRLVLSDPHPAMRPNGEVPR